MNFKSTYVLCGLVMLLSACGSEENGKQKPDDTTTAAVAGKDRKLFPFYKNIEVRPGLTFEVLSWGHGVDTIGGYLLLMSDSIRNNFKSLSAEREGILTDAWNLDLDTDGDPEIYVQLLTKKNVSDLQVYEYSNGSFDKIVFPGLSNSLKKEYAGNDKYVIRNGELYRTFPVAGKDSTSKSQDWKQVQYKLIGNRFSMSELKNE